MDFILIVFIWYILGIIPASLLVKYDVNNGHNFTLYDFMGATVACLSGPMLWLLYFVHVHNFTIIKGRRK